MREFLRYVLWQLPGWTLVGAGLVALHAWLELSRLLVAGIFALYVAKDLLLFPAMRAVFRPVQGPTLVGARGQTVEELRPIGYVRINGELWRARTQHHARVPAGRAVVVRAAAGLTLIVEDAHPARPPAAPDGPRPEGGVG
jgi:membrane protein implicated in regulation of membrane protease activity